LGRRPGGKASHQGERLTYGKDKHSGFGHFDGKLLWDIHVKIPVGSWINMKCLV